MTLLLNPILEALESARRAAPDAINPTDEVTMEDQGDCWVFEFVPDEDSFGGGATVSIAKADFRILRVVRSQ